jgi:hypothetical protein
MRVSIVRRSINQYGFSAIVLSLIMKWSHCNSTRVLIIHLNNFIFDYMAVASWRKQLDKWLIKCVVIIDHICIILQSVKLCISYPNNTCICTSYFHLKNVLHCVQISFRAVKMSKSNEKFVLYVQCFVYGKYTKSFVSLI